MKIIGYATINNGTYYSKTVEGSFECISPWKAEPRKGKDGICQVVVDGKVIWVAVNFKDYSLEAESRDGVIEVSDEDRAAMTAEENAKLEAEIAKRFRVMNTILKGVVGGDIPSVIISGAPGCGKSYTVEELANRAKLDGELNKVHHVKGKMSAFALFLALWENRDRGDLLVLDDADSIFEDQDAFNIMKAALDSGARRTVHWATMNSHMQDNDIPQHFEYRGSVIFLTNKDFNREIDRNSRMSPHFKALVSRCGYLDLKVHQPNEILIRVKQVVKESDLMYNLGMPDDKADEIIEWVDQNVDRMREVSIRTINKLAGYVKSCGDEWKDMAEVMMLK